MILSWPKIYRYPYLLTEMFIEYYYVVLPWGDSESTINSDYLREDTFCLHET